MQFQTRTTKNRLIGHSIEGNDEWGEIVKARLEHCIDIVVEEAMYYDMCQKRFILKKKTTSETPGRPGDLTMAR